MKVLTKNAIYVQKRNLNVIKYMTNMWPKTLLDEAENIFDGYKEEEWYDFVKFENDKNISFFLGALWIVDYDEVKSLTEEEIRYSIEATGNQFNKEVAYINNNRENMDLPEIKQRLFICKELMAKSYDLNDYLNYKLGNINVQIPEENKSLKRKKTKRSGSVDKSVK